MHTSMKKFTLSLSFIFVTTLLLSQVIQMDIPVQKTSVLNPRHELRSDFLKQPYLIFEGINTQMRVIWQLNETSICQISWGADSTCNLGNEVTSEYGDDHQHGYTITGLTPATKYYYKVIYDDVMHVASFRTAPLENETDLKFFVYGDTRADTGIHDLISGAMIADYSADPEFQTISLFTGDHVSFGAYDSSWQNDFFSSSTLNIRKRMAEVPFISCLGNHELYLNNYSGLDLETTLFGKYFPFPFVERRYWSFDYGPVHVTVLDQYPDYYVMIPPIGYLDAAQIAWLEEDLSNTDKLWKIIIMHEPGWSCEGSSSGYSHPNNPDVQNLLQPLCEQYGVQIVFTAHNHYYARACKNGIFHITTAGGGAPLYDIEEEFPNVMHTKHIHHYCRVVIEDTLINIEAVGIDGTLIDEFTVNRNRRPSHQLGFLAKEDGPGEISDAEVQVNDLLSSPDETGYYGLLLEPGTHEINFSLESYETIVQNIEIIPGTENQLDTTLVLWTGLVEVENKSDHILCWPDPCVDYVIVENNLEHPQAYLIAIINSSGKKVFSRIIKPTSSKKTQLKIDVSSFSPGIYFIQLQADHMFATKKVVKL